MPTRHVHYLNQRVGSINRPFEVSGNVPLRHSRSDLEDPILTDLGVTNNRYFCPKPRVFWGRDLPYLHVFAVVRLRVTSQIERGGVTRRTPESVREGGPRRRRRPVRISSPRRLFRALLSRLRSKLKLGCRFNH